MEKEISKRYAKSLMNVAIKRDMLNNVYDNVTLIYNMCAVPLFGNLIQNPTISTKNKIFILNKICEHKLDIITKNFLELLTQKKRYKLLCEIFQSFLKLHDEYTDTKNVYITTATKIDKDLLEKIKAKALKIAKCTKIRLIEKIEPKIIGGYILQMDDKQIDASFNSELKVVNKTLVNDI